MDSGTALLQKDARSLILDMGVRLEGDHQAASRDIDSKPLPS